MAIKLRGALTTNSHSNELKCMLVERILEKTAQHGFISMSRATERSAHRRRQGAVKVGKKGVFPTHGECIHVLRLLPLVLTLCDMLVRDVF